ncbi:hypothetical protein [uncultured Kriegella sp.]|uniref:hypothetical protein n=1 Tax=uncultured Kriegella sp. TaxID=1798910 RepID=UPI0030D7EC9F
MKKTENCAYCGEDYVPKRRGAQLFCSNSCRSLNWRDKQRNGEPKKEIAIPKNEAFPETKMASMPEKMSLAGVGNAAAGAAAVELAKTMFTPAENKPATKKDIQELKVFIRSRYLFIKNLQKDATGRNPYYDVQTGYVVYI